MSFSRADRVADQLQREISRMLYEDVKDPRIGMVTISRVQLTPDLRYARVYYTIMGDDAQKEATQQGLSRSVGFIRRELGRLMHIRFVPEIIFLFDPSLEHAQRINTLLKEIERTDAERQKALSGEQGDAAATSDASDEEEDEDDDALDEEDDDELDEEDDDELDEEEEEEEEDEDDTPPPSRRGRG